jgi:hypothetical protein
MMSLQASLDYNDAIASWYIDRGVDWYQNSQLEKSAQFYQIAANILSRQNRTLTSPRLEKELIQLAGAARDVDIPNIDCIGKPAATEVCLHVMSEFLPAGGISVMVTRWLKLDRKRTHYLAVIDETLSIPDDVRDAIHNSGGSIFVPPLNLTILQRALWLRTIAQRVANYVILHINPTDILYVIAFGVKGGPRTLLVNYTAHSFWVGGSIADLTLNIRGSDDEIKWAAEYRRLHRFATLPIAILSDDAQNAPHLSKAEAKARLGIPTHATCLLTVGASFKYSPANNMNFLQAIEGVLTEVQDAFLLVVGFHGDKDWKHASDRVGGRIKTYGAVEHSKLSIFHQASDVYVEGFPFGTTTALLEAGSKGIPIMPAPKPCPPPYSSDGIALDHILCASEDEFRYKRELISLILNPDSREALGERLQQSIKAHHTGKNWQRYLDDALELARTTHHSPSNLPTPLRTPVDIHEYWSSYINNISYRYDHCFEMAMLNALSIGFIPKIESTMIDILRVKQETVSPPLIPIWTNIFFFNFIAVHIRPTLAINLFRGMYFCARPDLGWRLISRIRQMLTGSAPKAGMYAEYRQMARCVNKYSGAGHAER